MGVMAYFWIGEFTCFENDEVGYFKNTFNDVLEVSWMLLLNIERGSFFKRYVVKVGELETPLFQKIFFEVS